MSTGFHVSGGTLDTVGCLLFFAYETITLYGVPSHALLLRYRNAVYCPYPEDIATFGFGLFRVRSPLLTESRLISFPRPT